MSPERQRQALVRLRRYAGRERGYEPITTLARARIGETLGLPPPGQAARVAPWSVELEQSLENQARFVAGIRDLFQSSGLKGWEKDMKILSRQIDDYGRWVKSDLLPRARFLVP